MLLLTSENSDLRFSSIGLVGLLLGAAALAPCSTTFRYFHDDSSRLYRVLDSTGNLIQYTYDPSGNITQITRSSVPPGQLSILNVTPATTAIGGNTMTIMGQNFSTSASANTVTIGGVAATVISASSTQLVISIPTNTSGGVVSVTAGGVSASYSNPVNVLQSPVITNISPATGPKGTTVAVVVTGQNLLGATFAFSNINPLSLSSGGFPTVTSASATSATLSLALGTTEGAYTLVATTPAGSTSTTLASTFVILPSQASASFVVSVLNTAFNPSSIQALPTGQNSASFDVSVLNTASSPTSIQALPTGQNSASFDVSVLNTASSPSSLQALPAGQNSATFDVSVLNTASSPSSLQALPAGQNSAAFDASVLNTALNPNSLLALPAGQNSASDFISVCNTASGCTAIAPHLVSVNASPASSQPRPADRPLPVAPSRDLPPVLEPLDKITSVTVGQTIRLGARNVEPGSTVEFDVNQTAIAKVSEPPYETLFTVPEGPAELVFQAAVGGAGQAERVSQSARMTVVPDSGANVLGSIAQGTGGVELSLAAGGLKEEFFHLAQPVTALPDLDGVQPVRSGYVTAINEPNPGVIFGDDPLGAHLASDYAIRFSGEVRVDEPGQYRFWLTARSGAAIRIDGKMLADSGFVTGEPSEAAITLALDRGWHSIEVIYYLAVGAASVQLDWQRPGGSGREVVGPEYLRSVLGGMTAVSAADGTFVFPRVPTKFDSVWIRAKQGNGFIEFPAIGPAAGPVSIAVPK